MAERQPAKAKKRPPKATVATAPSATSRSDRVSELESERDRLVAELEAAKARIEELEQARDKALNHIDWVIDSLHSLERE